MNKRISYHKFAGVLLMAILLFTPNLATAQADFNPDYIISDEEMQSTASWTRNDVQSFLDNKQSYLAKLTVADIDGVIKPAADIIYGAATTYGINPKFLLVTLQKEQSLITDDSPTQKQLDWATGYAVCDGCYLNDPKVQQHKGFANQVDNAAGIIRWYYDNSGKSFVKKKNQTIAIDNLLVTPQTWATAFLYTYTPHLHGNQNFWRIWNTWFSQIYPNGSLLKSVSSSEVWLIQNNVKRKFLNQSTLLSRADPNMIIAVPDSELSNYQTGASISFPNYSILKSPDGIYLLDYDTLRPFASESVVSELGYNPQEVVDVTRDDLAGYPIGETISTTSTAPQGVVYQITDAKDTYYFFKDNILHPLSDKQVVKTNFAGFPIEKHTMSDLKNYKMADLPTTFRDGSLLKENNSGSIYVIENGKKRKIADEDTFAAMGYKKGNMVSVEQVTLANIFSGEPLFLNSNLLSAKNKFLGDSESLVDDLYKTKLPAYLVAEYPSGRIISGKNIDVKRPIASLTKLMIAYQSLNEGLNLNASTIYSAKKHKSDGNILKLAEGAKIKNSDLLYATLIGSTNNTARMLAQTNGVSEKTFINDTNTMLSNWGADNTTIADASGLDQNNKSTARDLLKIFTKITTNAKIKDALSKSSFTFKELPSKNGAPAHTIINTNKLLAQKNNDYTILASKTGYTDEAGSVLIMIIKSKKTAKQYTIITMGNSDYTNRFVEPGNIAKWISSGKVQIANK